MKKLCWLSVVLILWALPVLASAAVPRDIRDLIILGLEKNIGLQVERINVPLSAEQIKIEAAAFDSEFFATAEYAQQSTPQSSLFLPGRFDSNQAAGQMGLRKRYENGLSAQFSLNSDRTTDNDTSDDLDPRYRTALLLDLTQPLLRNYGAAVNTTQLRVSRNQSRQLSYDYFLQAQRLALQVETLALQLAGETEIVSLRKQAVQLAEELHAANQRRFDAGVIPVSEVQEAETDLANRQLNLSLALQSQELQLEQLNRFLDYNLPTDFSAEAIYSASAIKAAQVKLELPEFEQLFTAAKAQRLDLKISSLEIENSSLQKGYFKNQQKPQLDLKLQGGLNGLAGEERSSSPANRYSGHWGDSFNSMSDGDGFQWRAGLEFSLPLGNQAAKARFRQSVLQGQQAVHRQRDLESALKYELLEQQTLLQRAAEQFEIADIFQRLAMKSFHQEQRRLEEGLSDTFRMVLFQDKMINAKIDRISALTQYHQAVAKMNFSRGIILEQHGITVKLAAEEAILETL